MLRRQITWGLVLVALFVTAGTALAFHVPTALYQATIDVTNVGSDQNNVGVETNYSGSRFIDDALVNLNFLNTIMHQGHDLAPSMPPNNRIVLEGAVIDDGGSFVEFTTAIRDSTPLDAALLPPVPVTGDAVYFGFDNPARILSLNIGQPGIGGWVLAWEYSTGPETFASLTNVTDNTDAFTNSGLRTVLWDIPTNWTSNTVTGSAVDAYWARATATVSGATPSQQAIASQGWYENGRHWTWVRSLAQNELEQFVLSYGGPDQIDQHQIFPGLAGIVTPDNASIELGNDFTILARGGLNFSTLGPANCILCKPGALAIYPSANGEVTASVTGAGNTTLTVTGISTEPTTGSTPGQTVTLTSDGSTLTLTVDASTPVTGAAQTITDNANSWTWASNGALVYVDEASLTIGITGALLYRLNTTPGVTVEDLSVNTNDGTMSYPVADVAISGTIAEVVSVRVPISGVPQSDFASAVTGSATDLFQEGTGIGLPIFAFIDAAATDANIPIQFFWVLFVLIGCVALGVIAVKATSSVAIGAVVMGTGFVFAAVMGGTGLIPMWSILIFVLVAAALLMLRPKLPL